MSGPRQQTGVEKEGRQGHLYSQWAPTASVKKYVNLFSLKDSDGNESHSLHKKLNRLTAIAMEILTLLHTVIILN